MNAKEVDARADVFITGLKKEYPHLEKELDEFRCAICFGFKNCSTCGWNRSCAITSFDNVVFEVRKKLGDQDTIDRLFVVLLPVLPEIMDVLEIDGEMIAKVFVEMVTNCKKRNDSEHEYTCKRDQ